MVYFYLVLFFERFDPLLFESVLVVGGYGAAFVGNLFGLVDNLACVGEVGNPFAGGRGGGFAECKAVDYGVVTFGCEHAFHFHILAELAAECFYKIFVGDIVGSYVVLCGILD